MSEPTKTPDEQAAAQAATAAAAASTDGHVDAPAAREEFPDAPTGAAGAFECLCQAIESIDGIGPGARQLVRAARQAARDVAAPAPTAKK